MATDRTTWRMEQHIGTIMQAVVITLLVWFGNSTVQLREEVRGLKTQIAAMQGAAEKESRHFDESTQRDRDNLKDEIRRLESRVSRCEEGRIIKR